jgi:hypothetical protein
MSLQLTDIRQVVALSGAMAAGLAADAEILQLRWAPTENPVARLAVLGMNFGGAADGTGFAAGNIRFRVHKVTSWTAAGTGGGTIDLTGDRGQLNPAEPASDDLPSIRVATTAPLLRNLPVSHLVSVPAQATLFWQVRLTNSSHTDP